MNIKNNIDRISRELPSGCKLVVVSKTQSIDLIKAAYEAGQRDFGENKVQELVDKYPQLPGDIRWHLIGHLQSNKVKYIAPFVHLIHSVDSLKLLREIQKQASKVNRVISCLLQVHIASEDTKFGLSEEELLHLIHDPGLGSMSNVRIIGLMGMATFTEDDSKIEREFKHLHDLFERLKTIPLPENVSMEELSIGMSSDYMIAINSGSTIVRVGTAIFGERKIKP